MSKAARNTAMNAKVKVKQEYNYPADILKAKYSLLHVGEETNASIR